MQGYSGIFCSILSQIYGDERESYEREAKRRSITIHQLAAAAIAGAVLEMENIKPKGTDQWPVREN